MNFKQFLNTINSIEKKEDHIQECEDKVVLVKDTKTAQTLKAQYPKIRFVTMKGVSKVMSENVFNGLHIVGLLEMDIDDLTTLLSYRRFYDLKHTYE